MHSLFEWDFATILCAAHTILILPYYHKSEKDTSTTHCYSTSIVVFIVLTCVVGQTMTGSPQTRSSGQVQTSLRRNKVVQKTGKVKKLSNTSASRRNLNGRSRGREIAAKPWEEWMINEGMLTGTTSPPTRGDIVQWTLNAMNGMSHNIVFNAWRHGQYTWFPTAAPAAIANN